MVIINGPRCTHVLFAALGIIGHQIQNLPLNKNDIKFIFLTF